MMDTTVAAGLIGAGAAVLGATVGGATSIAVESRRAREAAREAHRADLRSACADFTTAVARVRSLSYALPKDAAIADNIAAAMDEARAGCERLRILVSDSTTQRAARLALRHSYAVWQKAETGIDPRAADYPSEDPHTRLRMALTDLYIGVRRELSVPHPEDVFVDLDD